MKFYLIVTQTIQDGSSVTNRIGLKAKSVNKAMKSARKYIKNLRRRIISIELTISPKEKQ